MIESTEIRTIPDSAVDLYVKASDLPGAGRGAVTIRVEDAFGTVFVQKFIGQRWKIRVIAEAMIAALDTAPATHPLLFPIEATVSDGA